MLEVRKGRARGNIFENELVGLKSIMAQRKRAGLITRRTLDRNQMMLCFSFLQGHRFESRGARKFSFFPPYVSNGVLRFGDST